MVSGNILVLVNAFKATYLYNNVYMWQWFDSSWM